MRTKQLKMFKDGEASYGGELLKTRKGRSGGRTLSTTRSIHLVLRSSKATGPWSFRKDANAKLIQGIIHKFSQRFGVKVLSLANVGNHLHLHIQLRKHFSYKPWIRAVTASIAMKITGISRWTGGKSDSSERFWDYRPFSRIVIGWRAVLTLRDYFKINRLEGLGVTRKYAEWIVKGPALRDYS